MVFWKIVSWGTVQQARRGGGARGAVPNVAGLWRSCASMPANHNILCLQFNIMWIMTLNAAWLAVRPNH